MVLIRTKSVCCELLCFGFTQIEKEKQERKTTEERQDMTNVNNGLPCQVINSKLLRYHSISQKIGREGNSYCGDLCITSKSKYYIARQTRGLAGNEASCKSTGAEKKEIMVRFDEENTEATLKQM